MRGATPKSERFKRNDQLAMTVITGEREAYYYIKDASGQVTWYVEGLKAMSAWEQAGGYGKASLYCGRKPHAMTRVR